jgi:Zn-dependent protease with chaperone function
MEFKPRVPREGINVSRDHPLREAATLIAGATAVLAVAFGLVAWGVDALVTWIPAETEARLFTHRDVALAGVLPADPDQRAETVLEVLERLANRWPDRPYSSFRIAVLDSEDQNAGALPGGLIVVTSGLLDGIQTENELAFVLGHELGHFRGRHHLRRLGRGVAWGLVLAVLGGSGNNLPDLASLVGGLTSRGFDRDQEREADRFAMQVVQAEYGHAAEATGFLERLDEEGNKIVAYLSTHPGRAERVEELRVLASERGWRLSGPSMPLPASWTGPPASEKPES